MKLSYRQLVSVLLTVVTGSSSLFMPAQADDLETAAGGWETSPIAAPAERTLAPSAGSGEESVGQATTIGEVESEAVQSPQLLSPESQSPKLEVTSDQASHAPSEATTTEIKDSPTACGDDQSGKQGCEPTSTLPQQSELTEGARFPIVIDKPVTSKTAKVGDLIEAHLANDLTVGGKLVASRGCKVTGHVCTVQPGRKVLRAELSLHRWLKSAGELGIQFDDIVTDGQEHLLLIARPAKQRCFVKDKEEGRVLGINAKGEIVSPLSVQIRSQSVHWTVHVAGSAAGIAGGPIGLSVIPAAFACIGAIDPSFGFMHPVGKNVKHRRIKGAALGFISGVPFGGLICDAIVRGPEAIIEPGDLFEAEVKQELSGTSALLAQHQEAIEIHTTVHGQVLPRGQTQ